jgi:hypothetical protein
MKHHETCLAPICCGDPNPNYKKEVIWIPGERVCSCRPYQKFQKIQLEINKMVKKGKFKQIDRYFTADELERLSI